MAARSTNDAKFPPLITTPTRLAPVVDPPPGPRGIDWSRLSERDLAEMPVLAELRARDR
jgi:hypothetical protein